MDIEISRSLCEAVDSLNTNTNQMFTIEFYCVSFKLTCKNKDNTQTFDIAPIDLNQKKTKKILYLFFLNVPSQTSAL